MKKISNKDFLEPLKNRPDLEPSIEFKNQLLRELQTVKPSKQRMKSVYIAFLASAAALIVFSLFSGEFWKKSEVQESKGNPMLMRSMDNVATDQPARIQAENPFQIITNEKYHVALSIPKDWSALKGFDDKYGGEDGFVQLNAFKGDSLSIDEVAKITVEHPLKPFGTKPEITSLEIHGQEARLIMPTENQVKNEAEMIIELPKPIVVSGRSFSYLIVDADVDHIRTIAESFQFLE